MNTNKLMAELEAEMNRLTVFYEALKRFTAESKPVPALEAYSTITSKDYPAKPKGKLSPEGLERIRAAQRARHAASKRAKKTKTKR